jgi:NitT/TauT family transport system permease protein
MIPAVIAKIGARSRNTEGRGRNYLLGMGRLGIGVAFCLVWWAAVRFGVIDKFFLSSPDAVLLFVYDDFRSEIVPNGIDTLLATLTAFVLSGFTGVLGGLLLVEVPLFRKLIDPFLTALNSMPRIALAPIFILWFGIGLGSKIALAFSLGFFIVLNNTIAGMRNIDPVLMRLSHTLGCSSFQQFWKITLPWAIPSVFAGLKLALIYSFLGVVTSEMIASRVGLGNLIMYYSGIFRMDAVLGILLVMAACSVVITMIADFIENLLVGGWTETTQSTRR